MITNYRPLTLEVIWNLAEALIFQNGSATDADIYRAVCRAGYEAKPDEVYSGLALIAEEDNWSFQEQEADRRYFFEEDTDEVCHVYLERGNLFWEAAVVGNHLFRSDGRVGSLGRHRSRALESNRYAFHQLRNLLKAREQQGYELAEDVRPDLSTRLAYWDVLRKSPWEIRMVFRAVSPNTPAYTLIWNRAWEALPLIELLAADQFLLKRAGARAVLENDKPLEVAAFPNLELHIDQLQEASYLYGPGERIQLMASRFMRNDFLDRVRLLAAAALGS